MKIFTKWGLRDSGLPNNIEKSKLYIFLKEIYTVSFDIIAWVKYHFKIFLLADKFENIEVIVEGDTMLFSHMRDNQILEQFEYHVSYSVQSDWIEKFETFWNDKTNMHLQIVIKGEDLNFQLIKLGKIKGIQKYILMSQLIKSRFSPQEWVCPLRIRYPRMNTQLLFVSLVPTQTLKHHFLILKNLNLPISSVASFELKIAGETCAYLSLNYALLKDVWIFVINKISVDNWQMYLIKNGAFYFIRNLDVSKSSIDSPQKFSDILDQVESSIKFAKREGLSENDKAHLILSNFDESFDDIECFESMRYFEKIQFDRPYSILKQDRIWNLIRDGSFLSKAILQIKRYRLFSGLLKNRFKIASLEKNMLLSKILKWSFVFVILMLSILLFCNLKDSIHIYRLNHQRIDIDRSLNEMHKQFEKQQQQNMADLYAIFLQKYNVFHEASSMSSLLMSKLKQRFDVYEMDYSLDNQLDKLSEKRLTLMIIPKFFTYASDASRQYDILFDILKQKCAQFGISEKSIIMKKVKTKLSGNFVKNKEVFRVEISLTD